MNLSGIDTRFIALGLEARQRGDQRGFKSEDGFGFSNMLDSSEWNPRAIYYDWMYCTVLADLHSKTLDFGSKSYFRITICHTERASCSGTLSGAVS